MKEIANQYIVILKNMAFKRKIEHKSEHDLFSHVAAWRSKASEQKYEWN